MDYDVLMLGSGTARLLARSGLVGSVHSVFENVVNLRIEDNIVSLQHSSLPRTPLMLVVGSELNLKDLRLEAGSHIWLEQGCVIVKGHRFNFTAVPSWDAHLPVSFSTEEEVMILLKGVSQAVGLTASPLGLGGLSLFSVLPGQNMPLPDLDTPMLQAAIPVLRSLVAAIGQDKELELLPALTSLIGLGPGLTPSGDDFLIGLLSALSLLEKGNPRIGRFAVALRQAIGEAVEKTTPLSREFLLYACSGEFSEPFHELYQAAAALDMPGTLAAAIRFTAIGHTSGVDGLTGVLYGLGVCRSLVCHAPAVD